MHLHIYSSTDHSHTLLFALVLCSCSHPDRPTLLKHDTVTLTASQNKNDRGKMTVTHYSGCLRNVFTGKPSSKPAVLNWWAISFYQICWKSLITRMIICKGKSITVNITSLSRIIHNLIMG